MAHFILSAQNFDIYDADHKDAHARTGATSAEQLHRAGAQGVIIGHSEVGDKPGVACKKVDTILNRQQQYGPEFLRRLTVLVGETWEEFDGHSPDDVADIVAKRTHITLRCLPKDMAPDIVVGYEPKWGSRGSGRDDQPPPTMEYIAPCVAKMHEALTELGGESTPIIYGGRTTPERAEEILADPIIAGIILGSASSSVGRLMDIAEVMKRTEGQERKILHANFKAYNLRNTYEDYLETLKEFDDTFTFYLSPPDTDIYQVQTLLGQLQ